MARPASARIYVVLILGQRRDRGPRAGDDTIFSAQRFQRLQVFVSSLDMALSSYISWNSTATSAFLAGPAFDSAPSGSPGYLQVTLLQRNFVPLCEPAVLKLELRVTFPPMDTRTGHDFPIADSKQKQNHPKDCRERWWPLEIFKLHRQECCTIRDKDVNRHVPSHFTATTPWNFRSEVPDIATSCRGNLASPWTKFRTRRRAANGDERGRNKGSARGWWKETSMSGWHSNHGPANSVLLIVLHPLNSSTALSSHYQMNLRVRVIIRRYRGRA